MRKYMYYTPGKLIPAFVLIEMENGERFVEIYNHRTGKTDCISLWDLVEDLTTVDLAQRECFSFITMSLKRN